MNAKREIPKSIRKRVPVESSLRVPVSKSEVNLRVQLSQGSGNDSKHDESLGTTSNDHCYPDNSNVIFEKVEVEKIKEVLGITDVSRVPVLLGSVILDKREIARSLLKNGHPADSLAEDKSTPLMWAVRKKDAALINLLLQHDADPMLVDEHGNNAALIAIQSSSWDQSDFLDFWKSIERRISLNHANVQGNTILHYGIKRQWNLLLNRILKTDLNVNCANLKGITPLMMAGIRIDPTMVTALLQSDANILQEDFKGCTALCYSIAWTMQKKLKVPHPSLEKLTNAVNMGTSNVTIEVYLKRRLELLINPLGPPENYVRTIKSVGRLVFAFFARYIESGLDILVRLDIFHGIREAIRTHMNDWTYLSAVLDILVEFMRSWVYVEGDSFEASDSNIMDLFVEARLPESCLQILGWHSVDSSTSLVVAATLEPLFAICLTPGKARDWFNGHFHLIKPGYSKFIITNDETRLTLPADDAENDFLKKTTEFRYLLTRLTNNENSETMPSFEPLEKQRKSKAVTMPLTPLQMSLKLPERNVPVISYVPEEKRSSYSSKLERRIPTQSTGIQSPEAGDAIAIQKRPSPGTTLKSTVRIQKDVKYADKFFSRSKTQFAKNENKNDDDDSSYNPRKRDVDEDAKSNKRRYTPQISDETISYLSDVFEEIVSSYRNNWNRDRELGYQDYTGDHSDQRTTKIADETNMTKGEIARLAAILPELEDSYIKKLTNSWLSLVGRIRQRAASWPSKRLKKMLTLIQVHLLFHRVPDSDDASFNVEGCRTRAASNDATGEQNTRTDDSQSASGKTQYEHVESVDRPSYETRPNTDSNTLETRHHSRTLGYQRFEQNIIECDQVLTNTETVAQSGHIYKALSTHVTFNSTCAFPESTRTSNTEIFLTIPMSPLVEQSGGTPATGPIVSENPDRSENIETVRTSVSRWAVLVHQLRNHLANDGLVIGKIMLSTPEQRKYFVISHGGNFGPIELGLDTGGNPLTVRRLHPEMNAVIGPLLALQHDHVSPFTMCIEHRTELFLASPLCEYNLGEYLMYLKMNNDLEQHSLPLVKQLLLGLLFLHCRETPVIHGNMKPSNLFIDRAGHLKLAEFGLWRSLYLESRPPSSSMIWFAHETYEMYDREQIFICSSESDIQVAGMLVHFILTGGLHPYGSQSNEILDNIQRGSPVIQSPKDDNFDLISWMLIHDSSDRPSIDQILR